MDTIYTHKINDIAFNTKERKK